MEPAERACECCEFVHISGERCSFYPPFSRVGDTEKGENHWLCTCVLETESH